MLIAGCGPAGAELARLLARRGVDVVLVEALPDLARAAFSSAALPLAALERLEIPAAVVAHRWSGWRLLGPGPADRHWQARGGPLGAVLDFAALRRWLAGQAQGFGAQIALGWRALAVQQPAATGGIRTRLRGPGGEEHWLTSRWVVDATGQRRGLLGDPPADGADPLVSGLGAEWLLELPLEGWRPWSDQLTFLLGSDWMPQGYGWVFPMRPGQLKLGVCRLHDAAAGPGVPPASGRRQAPLGPWLEATLARTGLAGARVLDRHGGLIRSTVRRREPHQRGRLIGLGDAVSTANLLGGEGIRHAMTSARVLAPLLLEALAHEPERLGDYPRRLRRELGWRWNLSGRLARRTWLGLQGPGADRRLERLLAGLERQHSAEDLSALLFDYRFERYGLRALPYLLGWRR